MGEGKCVLENLINHIWLAENENKQETEDEDEAEADEVEEWSLRYAHLLPARPSVRLSACLCVSPAARRPLVGEQKQKTETKTKSAKEAAPQLLSRLAKRKINNNNEQRISRVFSEGKTAVYVCFCVCVCVTVVLIHRHTGKEVPNGKTGQHWPSERGK